MMDIFFLHLYRACEYALVISRCALYIDVIYLDSTADGRPTYQLFASVIHTDSSSKFGHVLRNYIKLSNKDDSSFISSPCWKCILHIFVDIC